MCEASAKDLVEVVKYFRDSFDDLWQKQQMLRDKTGTELMRIAINLLSNGRPDRKRPGKSPFE